MSIDKTSRESAEAGVRLILEYLGEDPNRDGLQDTPRRVVKAFDEILAGYKQDPQVVLKRVFENGDDDAPDAVKYNGMVVLRDIDFYSMCEHHMLPFFGKAHIAYIPNKEGKIVGISKLARLVDVFAKRLQVQERMTAQIADAIESYLNAAGVMVVIEAQHLCMLMRGIKKANSTMVTSEVRGFFLERPKAKQEATVLLLGR